MPRRDADCVQVPTRARRLVIVDRRFVETAHRSGLQVHSWTINDEAEMRHLLDLGIDAIMTDRPRLRRELLVGRGQWHGAPVGAGYPTPMLPSDPGSRHIPTPNQIG